jgi:hypothetical protein
LSVILVFLLKPFIQKELWYISCINSLGSIAFLCLLIEQFKYHDYYIICLCPALVLNWLAAGNALFRLKGRYWWIKVSLFIFLCIALNYQFNSGKKNLRERYTEGNYWEQSHHRAEDYIAFRTVITQEGVRRGDCVVAGYDISPNNILYYLHLRGHRFFSDHSEDRIRHILEGSKPVWLISNDSAFTRKVNKVVRSTEVARYKYLSLHRLNY